MIVSPTVVLIDPTDDLQTAVDATPSGGVLELSPGTYTAPTGGLLIQKAIEIKGRGIGSDVGDAGGVVLVPFSIADNQPVIVIARTATFFGHVHLHDFTITGDPAFTGATPPAWHPGSHGIKIITTGTDGGTIPLENIILENLSVGAMGNNGIHSEGFNGSESSINSLTIHQVKVSYNRGHGIYLLNHVTCSVRDCYVHRNYLTGIYAWAGGYSIQNSTIEGCCQEPDALDIYTHGQVVLLAVRPCSFLGNHMEEFAGSLQEGDPGETFARRGLVVRGTQGTAGWVEGVGYDGGGFVIEGNIFVNNSETGFDGNERGIYVDSSCKGDFKIGPNFFRNANVPIEVANSVEGISVDQQRVEVGNDFVAHDGWQLPRLRDDWFRALTVGTLKGHLAFDHSSDVARIWNGNAWGDVLSHPVFYEDDMVAYEDEAVTY